MQKLGIADDINKKAVLGKGGHDVAVSIAEGRAEIGTTFISEVLPVKGAKVVGPLPGALHSANTYSAALHAHAQDRAGASDFLRKLTDPATRSTLDGGRSGARVSLIAERPCAVGRACLITRGGERKRQWTRMDPLKFVVLDEEDLEVALGSPAGRGGEGLGYAWRPQEKRVVVALNRFDWESAQGAEPQYRRRRAALRFERVLSCKCRQVDPVRKDAVLNLLAVEFSETASAVWRDHADIFRRGIGAARGRMS